MKKKGSFVIISIFLFPLIFSTFMISIKAEGEIPSNYNQNLDLDQVYIYNVTLFNTTKRLEWWGLDWTLKGFANTTPGGQIKVNFTGFYDKHPNDYNLFENSIGYLDVEFIENRFGNLVTNTTFYNVSNGEADMSLTLGYNLFKSGFLIPINNISGLKEQAKAQNKSGIWEADVSIEETNAQITFIFQQKSGFHQKTKSTYDKISGLLIHTNTSVGNYFLEMTLINIPNFNSDSLSVSSYHIMTVALIISIIITIKIRAIKKNRKSNFN
ncbi:hypothetical protein LCGC14_0865710 [marine sediment metagenome]|uniref:Uncharacterized protein n=1 Tax=marine sediment metagenome TaxID=412755 RepID=A0A0F9P647_9ZZZZ